MRDGRIQIAEGDSAKLALFLSNQTGRLNGFVVDGDKPLSAVLAVLVPKVETNSSPHYGYQTESDGSFDFTGVPAGDYYFFAVEETEFEYANPAVFSEYFPVAKQIRIEAGKTLTEKIPIVTLPKK